MIDGLRAVVMDMEGVLHVDWEPVEGVDRAVRQLAESGLRLAVLTNTTGATRAAIAERLSAMGVDIPAAHIVTAASAAAEHVRERYPDARIYLMVGESVIEEFAGVRLTEDPSRADVIVIGGPDGTWTYRRLNTIFRALMAGVPLVAMQRNRWWPTAAGPSLDAGMFVAGLEYATGKRATVIGKPSTAMYYAACALVGVDCAEALMVSDALDSDLHPARATGMRTCLVRTGKGAGFAVKFGEIDLDLPSLADLPEALRSGAPAR